MNKEFIPYEEALALKELEFDEECIATYIKDELFLGVSARVLNPDRLLAPLYQQAFRWFREEHKLLVQPNKMPRGAYFFQITPIHRVYDFRGHPLYKDVYTTGPSVTYDKAELACLKKLIEIVKQKKEDEKF